MPCTAGTDRLGFRVSADAAAGQADQRAKLLARRFRQLGRLFLGPFAKDPKTLLQSQPVLLAGVQDCAIQVYGTIKTAYSRKGKRKLVP